jgi:hypothetical protein
MSKLTYGERESLPKSDFALPRERKYPIEDKAHARNALGRVTQSLENGHISVSEANRVRAKAHAMLDKE